MFKACRGMTERKEISIMGERAVENRIKKLKALEEQKKELERQIGELQEEIKKDMESKGIEEMQAGIFIIRFTSVLSNRFDTKSFKEKYEELYKEYTKQVASRRFTIS
jgi:predicted phage-related endonuclease